MMVLCSVHAMRWAFSLFPCGASSEDDVEEEEEEDERMAHNGQALVDQLDKRIKAIQREMQEKRRSQVLPPPHPLSHSPDLSSSTLVFPNGRSCASDS